jgi:hypothetical protein
MQFHKSKDISSLKWGPQYWFVLHCMAYNYPENPNSITKRKYYDFVQNIPLFLPDQGMGDKFCVLLDKYPVSPYLDNRESFIRWMHFIHNKINVTLGKEQISLYTSLDKYHDSIAKDIITKKIIINISNQSKRQLLIALFIFLCLCFIFVWL